MDDAKSESECSDDELTCIHDCCEWEELSTTQKNYTLASNEKLSKCITIPKGNDVPFWGNPKCECDDHTTDTEMVDKVMDDDCTIPHAECYEDNR